MSLVAQAHHASQDRRSGVTPKDPHEIPGVVGGGYNNPLGRASLAGPVAPAGPDQAPALARASVVGVKKVGSLNSLPFSTLSIEAPLHAAVCR